MALSPPPPPPRPPPEVVLVVREYVTCLAEGVGYRHVRERQELVRQSLGLVTEVVPIQRGGVCDLAHARCDARDVLERPQMQVRFRLGRVIVDVRRAERYRYRTRLQRLEEFLGDVILLLGILERESENVPRDRRDLVVAVACLFRAAAIPVLLDRDVVRDQCLDGLQSEGLGAAVRYERRCHREFGLIFVHYRSEVLILPIVVVQRYVGYQLRVHHDPVRAFRILVAMLGIVRDGFHRESDSPGRIGRREGAVGTIVRTARSDVAG